MGVYRARDVIRVPGILSLSRIPLAVAFVFAVHRPALAFAILLAAGLSDVLDGWYARRYGQVTATGSVLDPITDKLFVTTVAIALVVSGHLTLPAVVLLSTREIGELPLVVWLVTSRAFRTSRVDTAGANVAGKAATALQFASVTVAIFRASYLDIWVDVTAVAGVIAALSYWRLALRSYARHMRSTKIAGSANDA